jgi:N-acetylglucosaminyldiphosphoundecaprenol N-acetyl-beta-D-mannosaminyltransferase
MANTKIERVNVLGVGVSAINIPMALEQIDQWIKRRDTKTYVTVSGVHGVMESQRDEAIRRMHNDAGMVTPDGMPLVWLGKMDGHKHMDRVYGPDLMLAIMEKSQKEGYRHYFYGGADGVPELLKQKLQEKFPGIQVVGTYSPPFRALSAEEDAQIVQMINDTQPDIVWIGLSTPKQEKWMSAHVGRIGAPVMIGVGAAFDFHAGLKSQAPRFIQRSGFEWLYRLVTEPKRLWKRYLVNNPLFILGILGQKLGLRKYSL